MHRAIKISKQVCVGYTIKSGEDERVHVKVGDKHAVAAAELVAMVTDTIRGN